VCVHIKLCVCVVCADQIVCVVCAYTQVDKMLPTYQGLYDIVLTGDGDMSVIQGLLQYLLQ